MRTIALILSIVLFGAISGRATNRVAASASQADVSAAVNLAADGDTILIPNGSAAWSGGISTNKQIIIRAQNYTPTPAGTVGPPGYGIRAGATTRNVTITNNSGSPLFNLTSGNSYHCGVGGIRFNEGSGNGSHIATSGNGSKVPLIFDCYFQNKSRNWPTEQAIRIEGRGGVLWNCVMEGTQNVSQVGEGSLLIKLPDGTGRSWNSPSTMGTLDTKGDYNFYVEDSTFRNVGACPDTDDQGRVVFRYFNYDGAWGATHGFTSKHGGRHWEYYNGIFDSNTSGRNISNRYFWCRAGTGIFTGNRVMEDLVPSDYGGTPVQLNIGDNTSPISGYPANDVAEGTMQPGWGHNGNSFISDPIYIWNQNGDFPYAWSFQGQPGGWQNVVQLNRDIFVNAGPKPGYTPYTYPHPFRAVVESGGPQPTPPPQPTPTPTPAPTPTPIPTATPTPTPGPSPAPLPEGDGLAAKYPGDANIANDPNVLFSDDFESYSSASQLTTRWNSFYQVGNTRIATEPTVVFRGSKSLEFTLPVTTTEVSNAVVKNLSPTQDVVFARVYTMFDPGYDVATSSNHNGIRIGAAYPGPGKAPNGSDFFLALVENSVFYSEADPGYTHVYIYHPEQRSQWGDLWFPDGKVLPEDQKPGNFGPYFVKRPNFIPQRGQWYSYEFMIKANTPGQRDGRIAFWIDGKLMADFQNVRLRDVNTLKMDQLQLELHARESGRVNKKWYDNLVVARSYVGPLVAGAPTPTPTPSPTATPTPTPPPTPTPTPAPSPTPYAHKISEIEGLQEALDGKADKGHTHP